jgi:hypothetical protein
MLASPAGDDLRRLIDQFEPLDSNAGREMAAWLNGVAHGSTPAAETHLLRTDRELLGFFAGVSERVEISYRVWPIIELRARIRDRGPQPALLLAAIARSAAATDSGFGHNLFDYAVAVAQASDAVVLLVEPDNPKVGDMWQDRYGLRPMEEPNRPGLLYFPTFPAPPALWP